MVYSFLHRYGRTPKDGIIHQSNRRYMLGTVLDNPPCIKALSHGAIFLATCNAILPLADVKLANTR